jgi:4-carboxymuconolactone decarboxylase
MSRLPMIDPERLDPAQAEVYNRIAAGPRGGVRGPHRILLHSPQFASSIGGSDGCQAALQLRR